MNIIKSLLGFKDEYEVSVEIYKSVLDRILKSVSSSNIEEGGKFLGDISEQDNRVKINVCSYIDAGPRVSNSRSHIIPDGEHQEYLFRLIEGYDPDIEHIGSWHSHHCNGLRELSNGDIDGYIHNVNHKNYNLNWFFVMLITEVNAKGLSAKYYLFHRGENNFYEIQDNFIVFPNKEYRFENILREVDQSTYSHRNQPHQPNSKNRDNQDDIQKSPYPEGVIRQIRADDKNWLEKTYPQSGLKLVRNKKDDSLSWKWTIPVQQASLEITYKYPSLNDANLKQAILLFKFDKSISETSIDLNETRFQKIVSQIEKFRNSSEKPKAETSKESSNYVD